jgi:nucleotide-binding universal stress UspA family protein
MAPVISRILVPVDHSAESNFAAAYAMTLADRFGASVELLHVVEDPFASGGWGSEYFVPDMAAIRQGAIDSASKRLDAQRAKLRARGVPMVATIRMGRPAKTIVEYAKAADANLIVMGTHGRTGASHLLMGSVAEHVVRTAPCPVLTMRKPAAARRTRRRTARAVA